MEQKHSYHLEKRIFVILIPIINAFNYYLTYSNIRFRWRTFLTFSIDIVIGYLAWLAVHYIIVNLDQTMPFGKSPLKRLAVQLITTLIAGLAVIIGLTIATNYLFTDHPVPISFFIYDLIIISIWVPVINGIYVGLHFYNEWQCAEATRIKEGANKSRGIKVKTGRQELVLNYSEIAGFLVDGEYVLCFTIEGKKYILDQSMDSLEKTLPKSQFFRLNRKMLVHRQTITGFQKNDYGKLTILFKSEFSQLFAANVSRIKASSFKEWFKPA